MDINYPFTDEYIDHVTNMNIIKLQNNLRTHYTFEIANNMLQTGITSVNKLHKILHSLNNDITLYNLDTLTMKKTNNNYIVVDKKKLKQKLKRNLNYYDKHNTHEENNSRYFIISLTIRFVDINAGHANWIVIDNLKKLVYLIEPHQHFIKLKDETIKKNVFQKYIKSLDNRYNNYSLNKVSLVYKPKYFNIQKQQPICSVYSCYVMLLIINSNFNDYSKFIRYIKRNNFFANIIMFHHQLTWYAIEHFNSNYINSMVSALNTNIRTYYNNIVKFLSKVAILKSINTKDNGSFILKFYDIENKNVHEKYCTLGYYISKKGLKTMSMSNFEKKIKSI
jgi:hypothetical protein